jgi:hypothetical protein
VILFVVLGVGVAFGQTPFTTDDAEVTDTGKFHLEVLNEYDQLQTSLAPSLRQDSVLTRLAYGAGKRTEVGVDVPLLAIFNAAGTVPQTPFGVSDIAIHVKVKLREEKDGSRMPALAGAFYVRLPTGDAARSLGSGRRNYQLYGVAQKTLTPKTKLRANLGVLLAGNTEFGALGVRRSSGKLFSGGVSLVKQYTDRLRLGVEVTGVASGNLHLSKGQLQTTVGGNYQLNKKLTLDFGLLAGRFPASPRVGGLIGFSYDF